MGLILGGVSALTPPKPLDLSSQTSLRGLISTNLPEMIVNRGTCISVFLES